MPTLDAGTSRDANADDPLAWLNRPVPTEGSSRRLRRGRRPCSRPGRVLSVTATTLALSPILTILATRVARIVDDPFLTLYGAGVLCGTVLIMGVSFGWYRDKSRGVSLPADPPLVTAMFAVHNDIDVVERCVLSILDSDYPNLELIVVDDASTDGTTQLLAGLAERRGFTFIPLKNNVGKKRALVVAAAKAAGAIFVFTDSDCIASRYAISQCVKALIADPRIGGVSGHARALNASRSIFTRIQDPWYDGQFAVAKAAESVFGAVTCVSGPMAAFRREAVYNYFPAWANDRFLGREFKFATDRQLTGYVLSQCWTGPALKSRFADTAFVRDVDFPARKWRVEYVASARVLTNVPETFRAVIKQQVRWKKSFIRNLFFTGRFHWHRGPIPAFLFYGHVLWVCAAPVIAFRHLVWLPAHGELFLAAVYLCGVAFKGSIWAVAFKLRNPASAKWVYRPLMSMFSALCLAWLLPYSALTLRKSIWSRG